MDMDIFAVPPTPHLRRFEPLMAREVRHTLSLLPRPTAHFVAVLFYNYMRQMRRAWQRHFNLSFEMGTTQKVLNGQRYRTDRNLPIRGNSGRWIWNTLRTNFKTGR